MLDRTSWGVGWGPAPPAALSTVLMALSPEPLGPLEEPSALAGVV